jgi:hypothetical protein
LAGEGEHFEALGHAPSMCDRLQHRWEKISEQNSHEPEDKEEDIITVIPAPFLSTSVDESRWEEEEVPRMLNYSLFYFYFYFFFFFGF